MESVVKYIAAAVTESADSFARRFPHLFLIRPGEMPGSVSDDDADADNLDTEVPTSATLAVNMMTLHSAAHGKREQWVILPLVARRRNSNPPPLTYVKNQGLRMSLSSSATSALVLGRSRASDLWLPHPSVSQTHAHVFAMPDRKIRLIDQSSTNGTYLRGQRLAPGTVAFARVGEDIRFGAVTLTVADGAGLYRAIQEAAANS